jgi:pimeloyl-ACP methyl ester carboxylesterase
MPTPPLPPPVRRALPLLAALCTLGACTQAHTSGTAALVPLAAPEARPAVAPLVLRPCEVPGTQGPARCGTHEVFEDRAARAGRRIGLNVVVFPALSATPAPDPVYLLSGGPGQGSAELAPQLMPMLAGLRQERDIVLVDQRGTGGSNKLECPGGWEVLQTGKEAQLTACREALQQRADLRQYTTAVAADDLDEVAEALGHAKVNLVGASYGTRMAQVFLQRHPGRVRTVLARAVAPLDGFNILVDASYAAKAQLAQVLEGCAADAACRAAYPSVGPMLDALFAQVKDGPAQVTLPAASPGAAAATLDVTRETLSSTVYALLLSTPSRQRLPQIIHRMGTAGLSAMAPVFAQVQATYATVPVGMYLSVVCSEDMPRVSAKDAAALDGDPMGDMTTIRNACREWPRGEATTPTSLAPLADVPALLVSGELDPATTPADAEKVAAQLPRSLHLRLPGTSHVPLLPGCAQDLAERFVRSGSTAGLDASCTSALTMPGFALPKAPAQAAPKQAAAR